MLKTKVILFGGSFDPIHNGHLGVARVVLEKLCADQLIFVPAHRSPHKTQMPAPGHHRLEMIRRAIEGQEKFSVSDCELHRRDPSYTLETITFFRNELGTNAELFWLIGADQLKDFQKWYKVSDLLSQCRVAVMYRAGYPRPQFDRFRGVFTPEQVAALERNVVQTPLIDISSTEIRQKLAEGLLPPGQLPDSVIHYIQKHHLYGYSG